MQIWAESGKSAPPICNYSQILYQFLAFTQNLKRSQSCSPSPASWLLRLYSRCIPVFLLHPLSSLSDGLERDMGQIREVQGKNMENGYWYGYGHRGRAWEVHPVFLCHPLPLSLPLPLCIPLWFPSSFFLFPPVEFLSFPLSSFFFHASLVSPLPPVILPSILSSGSMVIPLR